MNQCVTLEIDGGGRRWICSAVYGSPQATNRVELWSHLLDIGLCIQDPWVVVRDFNDILSVHEVKEGNFYSNRSSIFASTLDSCGLFDLTTFGRRFTWFCKIQGYKEITKRLDRACCTTEWRLLFPEAFLEVLSRFHSDHCPLLIRCQGVPIKKGNRPFRFQAAWATHPNYKAIVQKSWDSTDFGIHRKLLGVQEASLEFNSTVFGNIFIKKRELESYLNRIQRKMEADDDPILKHKEEELRAEYNIVLAQEELLWYQKSRDQWVRYGDRNTSFFHMQIILRRKSNKVHGLLVSDGSWSDDPEVLQREDACDNLSKPVTMLEVKEALDNMSSFKAPGSDGFQVFFFKEYWDVVGHEASNLSILWNGNRLDSFQPRRGLRQGDPISPYLFVLCMERLACFISKQVDEGIWDGVAISRGVPRVSHLMFADNLLLFCKAKKSQVQNVVHTLELFCKASGMKVNIEKSKTICSRNISNRRKEMLSSVSHIPFTSDLGKYLRVNLNHPRAARSIFSDSLEKIKNRLASWKGRLLNRAGRLCLIKSVASSLPIYQMQVTLFPTSVCQKIDYVLRQFLWKGKVGERCLNLVKWSKVVTPRKYGGLGIRDTQCVNFALLGKLVWQLLHNKDKLWVRIMLAKYLYGSSCFSPKFSNNVSSTWRAIYKTIEKLRDGFDWCTGRMSQSFWYHAWRPCELAPLVPFVHISDSHLKLEDVWHHGHWRWDILCTMIPEEVKLDLMLFDPIKQAGDKTESLPPASLPPTSLRRCCVLPHRCSIHRVCSAFHFADATPSSSVESRLSSLKPLQAPQLFSLQPLESVRPCCLLGTTPLLAAASWSLGTFTDLLAWLLGFDILFSKS
ncbi:uncharacterized protein [Arachis hypogaea]|uniref:uncharacterized protein n=1 Tax=Arachis hypogaea TaxID=3818 RepID=UPI0010FC666C|nr:uncharacterized protein LOC114924228 [Arachis hypogaea]